MPQWIEKKWLQIDQCLEGYDFWMCMLALRMHCLHKDNSRVYFASFILYQPYYFIGRRSSESKTFVAMQRHAQRQWHIPVGKYSNSIRKSA